MDRPLCLHGCRVGGKDSTELVVKGARREAPEEFIQELKDFLQVIHICECLDFGGYGFTLRW